MKALPCHSMRYPFATGSLPKTGARLQAMNPSDPLVSAPPVMGLQAHPFHMGTGDLRLGSLAYSADCLIW